jgi:hypothetical protein
VTSQPQRSPIAPPRDGPSAAMFLTRGLRFFPPVCNEARAFRPLTRSFAPRRLMPFRYAELALRQTWGGLALSSRRPAAPLRGLRALIAEEGPPGLPPGRGR